MDLKIKDVADLLNVSETTVRRWLMEGKIPAYRLNNQYRFSRIEIENWVMNCKPLEEKEPGNLPSGRPQQYSLYRAIHRGGIYSDIAGDTKEELIRQTMKLVAPKMGLDGEVLADLLLDREALMPTALNHGIGVPHTRDFLIPGPLDVIITVFPQEPIEYGALDGEAVHTLFFLLSSGDKRHLHLLAKLAHLSADEESRALLRSKPSSSQLLDHIRTWESAMLQPELAHSL